MTLLVIALCAFTALAIFLLWACVRSSRDLVDANVKMAGMKVQLERTEDLLERTRDRLRTEQNRVQAERQHRTYLLRRYHEIERQRRQRRSAARIEPQEPYLDPEAMEVVQPRLTVWERL